MMMLVCVPSDLRAQFSKTDGSVFSTRDDGWRNDYQHVRLLLLVFPVPHFVLPILVARSTLLSNTPPSFERSGTLRQMPLKKEAKNGKPKITSFLDYDYGRQAKFNFKTTAAEAIYSCKVSLEWIMNNMIRYPVPYN